MSLLHAMGDATPASRPNTALAKCVITRAPFRRSPTHVRGATGATSPRMSETPGPHMTSLVPERQPPLEECASDEHDETAKPANARGVWLSRRAGSSR